jgi:predicted NBD/HSP70 family sugar kinase
MAAMMRRRIIAAYPSPRSPAQPAVRSGGTGRERQEHTMQSQSVILLAEVRHNELQTEAERLQVVNQACAGRPTAIDVVVSAGRRFQIALANAVARLHLRSDVQGVLESAADPVL